MIFEIAPDQLPFEGLCQQALRWNDIADGDLSKTHNGRLSELLKSCHISMIRHDARAPVLFYVGQDSPAASVFGAEWAGSAIGQVGIPDTEAEALCNQAYYDVTRERTIKAHICRSEFRTDFGVTDLFYFRVLIPVETQNKSRLVLCLADLIQSNS